MLPSLSGTKPGDTVAVWVCGPVGQFGGDIDPSFIITHRIGLDDAPAMYRTFRDKDDACINVVMKPGAAGASATTTYPKET